MSKVRACYLTTGFGLLKGVDLRRAKLKGSVGDSKIIQARSILALRQAQLVVIGREPMIFVLSIQVREPESRALVAGVGRERRL